MASYSINPAKIIQVDCKHRPVISKSATKAIRREGWTPCVLYRKNQENLHFAISNKAIQKILLRDNCEIYELSFNDKEKISAVIMGFAPHPIENGKALSIDFVPCDGNIPVKMIMPIRFINRESCAGIKMGGNLNIAVKQLKLLFENMQSIPSEIVLDLAKYQKGEKIAITDLSIPSSCKILRPYGSVTIATIQ